MDREQLPRPDEVNLEDDYIIAPPVVWYEQPKTQLGSMAATFLEDGTVEAQYFDAQGNSVDHRTWTNLIGPGWWHLDAGKRMQSPDSETPPDEPKVVE